MIAAVRFHDISVGHTVTGHESKCAHLHGHNYRVWFKIAPKKEVGLDIVGRVLDFSIIKEKLCDWLEKNWDHRFLIYFRDPRVATLKLVDPEGIVVTSFNPTAENMANYLLQEVGPKVLPGHVELVWVKIEETYKCSVEVSLDE